MLWAVLAEAEGLEIRAPKRWVAVATRLLICASGAVVGYLVRARLCRGRALGCSMQSCPASEMW